jgi:asparagine synthase (glutamine-hydrolysing)
MCGLTGFIVKKQANERPIEQIITSMGRALAHRGPDDNGVWIDARKQVALGHTRLAIQDISQNGFQPMHSLSSRYSIVFNGEIYNHLDIRIDLEKISEMEFSWNGHSDTETLLMAIEIWGLQRTLCILKGMFSFALFDNQERKLFLARDSFGEKPLYYGIVDEDFIFGSELKAIKKFPNFTNQISKAALSEYLIYGYVPSPLSIYENIYKLEPGHFMEISVFSDHFSFSEPEEYWGITSLIANNQDNFFQNDEEAISSLDRALKSSIEDQMISDVPLGAFLSGGIDSSTVVALMQEGRMDRIKTFTIGFEESNFNESDYAKAIARHLNTDHTEFIVTAEEAQAVIQDLPIIYDEPFSDSSQIPTFLVSKVASQDVKVSLSGDGGDEIFGGYNRYLWGPGLWNQIKFVPRVMRPILAACVNSVPNKAWLGAESLINKFNLGAGVESLNIKASKYSNALKTASTEDEFYKSFLTKWTDPTILIKGFDRSNDYAKIEKNFSNLSDLSISSHTFVSRMMIHDSLHYLPDDILCKVDRAAMANSLETRVPFLDHRVVETAWRMPASMKIRGSETKWALRQVLYSRVPKDLIERPKTGFAIPVGEWLRGPLRAWAESLLSETNLEAGGYFYPQPIRIIWDQHLSGQYDWTDRIWSILMFQSWLEQN